MLGKQTRAYGQIEKCTVFLTDGIVLSVDPSVGSRSSQPGWAVYKNGTLLESGTLEIDPALPIWRRLRKLVHGIRRLYKQWEPDVLVYEDIPAQRHGGGNAEAHASLLKALGAILSVSGPEYYVGLHPMSWKRMVRSTYEKGDREDAEEMGWIAIEEAKRIGSETQTRRSRKGRKIRTDETESPSDM